MNKWICTKRQNSTNSKFYCPCHFQCQQPSSDRMVTDRRRMKHNSLCAWLLFRWREFFGNNICNAIFSVSTCKSSSSTKQPQGLCVVPPLQESVRQTTLWSSSSSSYRSLREAEEEAAYFNANYIMPLQGCSPASLAMFLGYDCKWILVARFISRIHTVNG